MKSGNDKQAVLDLGYAPYLCDCYLSSSYIMNLGRH
jgi:hypothetical protein